MDLRFHLQDFYVIPDYYEDNYFCDGYSYVKHAKDPAIDDMFYEMINMLSYPCISLNLSIDYAAPLRSIAVINWNEKD